MSITTDLTKVHLQRSQLWTGEMKESLKDRLEGEGYVRWIADPDGDTMNIPSPKAERSRLNSSPSMEYSDSKWPVRS